VGGAVIKLGGAGLDDGAAGAGGETARGGQGTGGEATLLAVTQTGPCPANGACVDFGGLGEDAGTVPQTVRSTTIADAAELGCEVGIGHDTHRFVSITGDEARNSKTTI
jgi:hypothetical protein